MRTGWGIEGSSNYEVRMIKINPVGVADGIFLFQFLLY